MKFTIFVIAVLAFVLGLAYLDQYQIANMPEDVHTYDL
jgi:hypothetical protein